MKNENHINEDINGRVHSLDQSFRGLEKRLRAIERRLSAGDLSEGPLHGYFTDIEDEVESIRSDLLLVMQRLGDQNGVDKGTSIADELNNIAEQVPDIKERVEFLIEDNSQLRAMMEKAKEGVVDPRKDHERYIADVKDELLLLNQRLDRAENRNRINIGTMKVPLEMSGIAGSLVLFMTGGLILAQQWDIIRSAYFSFCVALVFAIAVSVKFYMENRTKVYA